MDTLKCPSCGHSVGEPVRPGHGPNQNIVISPSYVMICCKCFEFMQGTWDKKLRILTSIERADLLVHRGAEMIRFIQMAAIASKADEDSKN